MSSEIVDELALNFPIAKAADKQRTAILGRIAKHATALAEVASQVAALREVPASSWTSKHDAEAAEVRSKQRDLTAEEISIRQSIDEWYGLIADAEWPALRDAAIKSHEQITADVKKRLLGIGYVEVTDLGGGVAREELPGIIERHPEVRLALAKWCDLSDHHTSARRNVNAAALEACRREMLSYQQRATAGLVA